MKNPESLLAGAENKNSKLKEYKNIKGTTDKDVDMNSGLDEEATQSGDTPLNPNPQIGENENKYAEGYVTEDGRTSILDYGSGKAKYDPNNHPSTVFPKYTQQETLNPDIATEEPPINDEIGENSNSEEKSKGVLEKMKDFFSNTSKGTKIAYNFGEVDLKEKGANFWKQGTTTTPTELANARDGVKFGKNLSTVLGFTSAAVNVVNGADPAVVFARKVAEKILLTNPEVAIPYTAMCLINRDFDSSVNKFFEKGVKGIKYSIQNPTGAFRELFPNDPGVIRLDNFAHDRDFNQDVEDE